MRVHNSCDRSRMKPSGHITNLIFNIEYRIRHFLCKSVDIICESWASVIPPTFVGPCGYITFTKLTSVTGAHGLSVISEMHVANMKTEMYLMRGVGI